MIPDIEILIIGAAKSGKTILAELIASILMSHKINVDLYDDVDNIDYTPALHFVNKLKMLRGAKVEIKTRQAHLESKGDLK